MAVFDDLAMGYVFVVLCCVRKLSVASDTLLIICYIDNNIYYCSINTACGTFS